MDGKHWKIRPVVRQTLVPDNGPEIASTGPVSDRHWMVARCDTGISDFPLLILAAGFILN